MKKFVILISVYNDWKSVFKLLENIDIQISNWEAAVSVIIVNDASTDSKPQTELNLKKIKSVRVINMKKNKGHARCNAFAIRYLSKQDDFDHLIVMDGDGEDRPVEIRSLVDRALSSDEISVVAKRIKRSEGLIFQTLYRMHKLITYISTGKNINFGNYSCLTREDVKFLSSKESLWSSFSGSVKKHIVQLNTVDSIRGLRYFGPSQMSLFNLGIHSLSIIAVFKFVVFLRLIIFLILIYYFKEDLGASFSSITSILIIMFNLLIYLISLRENKVGFLNSTENIANTKNYTH
mgnify:CR=1 FL=1